MASGCLGLISFPREPGRVTLERIEALTRGCCRRCATIPGIGFVLVRSERHGALALGAGGTHLPRRRTASRARTRSRRSGPTRADHLRRTDGFPHCADLMVNSTYWPEFEEVAAFEELVGSHGGHGRAAELPVRAAPGASWPGPRSEVVGAERVHRIFRGWLAGARPRRPTRRRVASPGVEHAHLDLRRELGAPERRTRAAGVRSGARGEPREADREERAPVDRHRDPRREQRGRPRGRARGPGGRRRASAPSPRSAAARGRSRRAELVHAVEEVGVAGEVDARAPREPRSRSAGRVARPASSAGRWWAVDGRPRSRPPPSVVARGQLDARAEAARSSQRRPPPRGTISGTSRRAGAARADRGGRGAGGRSARRRPLRHSGRRRGGVAAQVPEPAAQHGVGEQPGAVELDQDGRVADERKAIVRQRITPFG